jgi:hypothetical protein
LREKRFSAACRPDDKDVALLQLRIIVFLMDKALIVIIYRDGERYLRVLLAYRVIIERRFYLSRLREPPEVYQKLRSLRLDYLHRHKLVAEDACAK